MATPQIVRHLFLHSRHAIRGAKFGFFGDWEVPLYYSTTILEEHEAVRSRAGLFDISHMGKFEISGQGTTAFLDRLLPRRIAVMTHGKALYMPLLNEQGGILDDIIVYRISDEHYFIIVNASNVEKDFRWISSHVPQGIQFKDLTPVTGLLALQGPAAAKILSRALGDESFTRLAYYHFAVWKGGMIARTGYTGEDGFEIMAPAAELEKIWDALLKAGDQDGLIPIGFGARDTLRLEAGMPLYGHDMDENFNPFELGIGWAIDLDKNLFIAQDALKEQKQNLSRRLVGFEMIDRGIPRQDYEIRKNGKLLGKVTSGSFSPTFKKNIGMGYVPVSETAPGNEIEIIVRDKPLKAKVIKLPFYKRAK